MNVDAWLTWAADDARRRGLDNLVPLLETLARSTRALRAADDASRIQPEPSGALRPQERS